MEAVVERNNMILALRRVEKDKGTAGSAINTRAGFCVN
jgi:hypothetical protein